MTTSIFSNSWIGIVFDGRNQQYGAYELRRIVERNMLIAFLISASLVSATGALLLLNNGNAKDAITDFISQSEKPKRVPGFIPPAEPKPAAAAPEPESKSKKNAPLVVVDADSLLTEDTTHTPEPAPEGPAGPPQPDGQAAVGTPGEPGGTGTLPPMVDEKEYIGGIEIMPLYPGGDKEMMKFFRDNIKYPDMCKDVGIEGKVYVNFLVDKDGYVTDVKVAKGAFKCLNDEAVRVVKMMPQWTPGMQNGQRVKVRYTMPIAFELN